MTAKLQGKPWHTPEGVVMDAPAEALVAPVPVMMAWSRDLGAPLLFLDVPITRRLTAHLFVSAAEQTIKAFASFAQLLEWCEATCSKQVAIVEDLLDDRIVVWYMAARTTHRPEVSHGEGPRPPALHGSARANR